MNCIFRLVSFLLIFSFHLFHAKAQDGVATHRKICDLPAEVTESSGIVISSKDKIWTHGDAGNNNHLFLVDTLGNLLRTVVIDNAPNMDWEDIARDNLNNIWINDAGNNGNGRRDLKIYKIPNPDAHQNNNVNAEVINFSFSDQKAFPPSITNWNYDIEAMIWYQDSIYLFTKDRSTPFRGYTKMFSLPAFGGNHTAQLRDSFYVDADAQRGRITAADLDTNNNVLALLTRSQIIFFKDFLGTNFFQGNLKRYFFENRTNQVEALAFISPNELYMTDEGDKTNNVNGALYFVNLFENPLFLENDKYRSTAQIKYNTALSSQIIYSELNEAFYCRIFSLSGQIIHQQTFTSNQEYRISLPSSGIYLINCKSRSGNSIMKQFYFCK